jgi:hypothetical protein
MSVPAGQQAFRVQAGLKSALHEGVGEGFEEQVHGLEE